jgi:hypothetical protein
VEFGDDLVEVFLGVPGIRGELAGDVAKDCNLLSALYGNTDESAIRSEELVDEFWHVRSLKQPTFFMCPNNGFVQFIVLLGGHCCEYPKAMNASR